MESLPHDSKLRRSDSLKQRTENHSANFAKALVLQLMMDNEQRGTPFKYEEASKGNDSQRWIAALEEEMTQIEVREVPKLVQSPKHTKPVKHQ